MSADTDIITSIDHYEWERSRAYHDEVLAPLFQLLEQVKDPEIPALSIWDMGILRSIEVGALDNPHVTQSQYSRQITVVITPTYSGCPAMDLIHEDIYRVLNTQGYLNVTVRTQLSPAWTTRWMSDDAKVRMEQSGIAPPEASDCASHKIYPKCPVCGSKHTSIISEFSSTACKALYRCNDCLEPFDYFKRF